MPELPEVEVTRRAIAGPMLGATVVTTRLGKPLRWPLGIATTELEGRRILDVRRRGKYLLVDLDQGLLLVHLGMSGSLSFFQIDAPDPGPLGTHDHFEMQTTHGKLRLHDPRRFGAVVYASSQSAPVAQKLLGSLGMEPLEDTFDFASFRQSLLASRGPIKPLLLNGKVVVGVGNIYASEVLFKARIHPEQRACDVDPRKMRALFDAIRNILGQAVAAGGTTLRDFSANGLPGHFQQQTQVYGRNGLPCLRCATPISLLKQGQRSTYYCRRCQL